MCEPATLAYSAAALVGGVVAAKALTPKIPQQADNSAQAAATTPPAPTPVAPPPLSVNTQTTKQPSKAPDVAALRKANTGNQTGYNASSASTLLTGPQGIDQSQLSIGRNTLLGS